MFDKQNLVTQANKLVMAPQKFSLDEKRFIICLTSKIKPDDKEFKKYRIKFDEYASFIGQKYDYVSANLPNITKSIMRQILEVKDDDEILRQRSIIIASDHYKKLGFVDVQFHPDLKEFLLDLAENFTRYKLENALHLSGKHSIRIYEIIKANEFKEQKNFRLSWSFIPKPIQKEYPQPDIQKLLGTDYKRFVDFEKRVLKPTQAEIKEHTDISFEYKKVKVSRFVVAVDFFIKENVPTNSHNQISIFDVPDQIPDYTDLEEMKKQQKRAIEQMDRGKLCRAFQDKIKQSYGVDYKISRLEEYSNQVITEVLGQIGTHNIKNINELSIAKYYKKILDSYKEGL